MSTDASQKNRHFPGRSCYVNKMVSSLRDEQTAHKEDDGILILSPPSIQKKRLSAKLRLTGQPLHI